MVWSSFENLIILSYNKFYKNMTDIFLQQPTVDPCGNAIKSWKPDISVVLGTSLFESILDFQSDCGLCSASAG